jgi:hypothetical protein
MSAHGKKKSFAETTLTRKTRTGLDRDLLVEKAFIPRWAEQTEESNEEDK